MKKLVLTIIGLLALFTIIRAQSEEKVASGRLTVHPGYMELRGENSSIGISFGFLDLHGGKNEKKWDLFPLKMSVNSGKKRFDITMSGFNFLTKSGVTIGKKINITKLKQGDVISIGGDVEVTGKVDGDVWTLGANIIVKNGGTITGNAVAVGGSIERDKKSKILGNREALEKVKLPIVDFFADTNSAVKVRLVIELFRMALFLLLLFIIIHFWHREISEMVSNSFSGWKESILYILLAVFLLPVLVLLLIFSIVGIFFVPFLVLSLIIVSYVGAGILMIRIGFSLVGTFDSTVTYKDGKFFVAGLVGYLIVEIPFLLGLILGFVSQEGVITTVGSILKAIGLLLWFLVGLYGLGLFLMYMRTKNNTLA